MSYLTTTRRRRPMGGFVDTVINTVADAIWDKQTSGGTNTETSACLAQANAQTATLDAKASDLSKNWRPSGFYSPDQVTRLVTATLDVIARARSAMAQVIADETLGDSSQLRGEWTTKLNRKAGDGTPYMAAARTAANAGRAVVNAPGLKTWVVNTMLDASSAMNAAYVIACLRPWWAGLFNAFATVFNALWSLAKSIVGVAVDVGTAVVKVAAGVASLPSILLIGGAAVAGYFVLKDMGKLPKFGS